MNIANQKGYASINNKIAAIGIASKAIRDRIQKGHVYDPINNANIEKINTVLQQLSFDFDELKEDFHNNEISKDAYTKYLDLLIYLIDEGFIKTEDKVHNLIFEEWLKYKQPQTAIRHIVV